RPVHRQLHRHPAGEHARGGEPDPAAGDVDGPADAGFGDSLAIEHLVLDLLVDDEPPLGSTLPVEAAECSIFLILEHEHRLPIVKLQSWSVVSQDPFGYLRSAITPTA